MLTIFVRLRGKIRCVTLAIDDESLLSMAQILEGSYDVLSYQVRHPNGTRITKSQGAMYERTAAALSFNVKNFPKWDWGNRHDS